jgi:hypothetical protein
MSSAIKSHYVACLALVLAIPAIASDAASVRWYLGKVVQFNAPCSTVDQPLREMFAVHSNAKITFDTVCEDLDSGKSRGWIKAIPATEPVPGPNNFAAGSIEFESSGHAIDGASEAFQQCQSASSFLINFSGREVFLTPGCTNSVKATPISNGYLYSDVSRLDLQVTIVEIKN